MASFRTGKFNKEATDERLAEPSSRKTLLQISRCICSEVSAQGDLRDVAEGNWRDIPGVVPAGWTGVSRRVCDAGSYSHAVDDFLGEIDPADEIAIYPFVYAVLRQYEPGKLRKFYYLPDDPLPPHLFSDGHFIHALFDSCEQDLAGEYMPSYPEILINAEKLRDSFEVAQ